MKKLMNLALYLVYLLFSTAQAGFDWGGNSGQCSGNGTFQQNILQNAVIQVGEIPIGKQDVNIKLTSSEDVDIQIYDKDTGNPIVGWNIGAPIGENPYSNLEYDFGGVHIKYSGYNGDGYNLGHEFIQLSGTLNRGLIMKAYGYKSGYATVNYSWKGTQGCTASGSPAKSGSGTFQQKISNKDIVKVGNLISGLENVYIELISNNDVDIQLYDGNTAIIQWPNGILNGPGYQTTNYAGMKIEWSGYNGDGTGLGHEYIKITGTIDRKLTMKAYGYKSGDATVNYSWGNKSWNSSLKIENLLISEHYFGWEVTGTVINNNGNTKNNYSLGVNDSFNNTSYSIMTDDKGNFNVSIGNINGHDGVYDVSIIDNNYNIANVILTSGQELHKEAPNPLNAPQVASDIFDIMSLIGTYSDNSALQHGSVTSNSLMFVYNIKANNKEAAINNALNLLSAYFQKIGSKVFLATGSLNIAMSMFAGIYVDKNNELYIKVQIPVLAFVSSSLPNEI